jgi:hypothetical protein
MVKNHRPRWFYKALFGALDFCIFWFLIIFGIFGSASGALRFLSRGFQKLVSSSAELFSNVQKHFVDGDLQKLPV